MTRACAVQSDGRLPHSDEASKWTEARRSKMSLPVPHKLDVSPRDGVLRLPDRPERIDRGSTTNSLVAPAPCIARAFVRSSRPPLILRDYNCLRSQHITACDGLSCASQTDPPAKTNPACPA